MLKIDALVCLFLVELLHYSAVHYAERIARKEALFHFCLGFLEWTNMLILRPDGLDFNQRAC